MRFDDQVQNTFRRRKSKCDVQQRVEQSQQEMLSLGISILLLQYHGPTTQHLLSTIDSDILLTISGTLAVAAIANISS